MKEQYHFKDSNRLDNKVYNTLLLILHLLNKIETDEPWQRETLDLLAYPYIDKNLMGFPHGWQNFPLWKTSPPKDY